MQELNDCIKRTKLIIMGIEKIEEVQVKGIHNIINKIIIDNLPNLNNVLPIQVEEGSRTQNRLDQNRTSHSISSLKQQAQRK
jgi:hypothetical protein